MLLTVDLERLRIRPGDTLLDAGCGEGRHCFGALEQGARVLGLDLDRDALKAAAGGLRTRGEELGSLGAMLQGGMGVAAGGNINPNGVSMFEPIGGSSPKYAGKNIINPMGAILAGKLMLETLGEPEAAQMVEEAVIKVLRDDLKGVGAGQMGCSTAEVGDLIAEFIKK